MNKDQFEDIVPNTVITKCCGKCNFDITDIIKDTTKLIKIKDEKSNMVITTWVKCSSCEVTNKIWDWRWCQY